MGQARLTITLDREEKSALMQLAQRERRDTAIQAALIIRRELERLELIPATSNSTRIHIQLEIHDGTKHPTD